MKSEENITKILLLGETGVGKSSLGNYIIGEEKFLAKGGSKRVTKNIEGNISKRESYEDIFAIDTPGFQDTNLEDEKFIEKLKNEFKDKNAGVRAICLLLNFCDPLFKPYLQRQIYIYCLLFLIADFWDHIAIVFTRSYFHFPDEEFNSMKKELESEDGIINEIINYAKKCTETINELKKHDKNFKKIKEPDKLPNFYVDSNLKINEEKNSKTKGELNKLIEWARKKDYLDLRNINKNKIDVNYLSSERIDDIIEEDNKFLDSSNILKLYSKKFYAQYKKTTFHNDIIIVKEPSPYKIEEIKEEKKDEKKLISSPEENNYKIYQIQHIAVKSKKRIIEKGKPNEWENIENLSDSESSRIISTDKLEVKINYEEKLIKEKEELGKFIKIYQKYKVAKMFLNGVEIKTKEKKDLVHTKKITKIIFTETTEKQEYNSNDLKFCEDIVKEKVITEYDDGTKPEVKINEINRKKRYFKTSTFEGEPFTERIEYMIYTKVKEYQREDETDETDNNIIKKGIEKEIKEKIIDQREERHIITTITKDYFEPHESYVYRDIVRTSDNLPAKIASYIGGILATGGGYLFRANPVIGGTFFASGAITAGVSLNFLKTRNIVNQRKKITITKKYLITYNIFSDKTEEEVSKNFINEEKTEGQWEDIDYIE